MQQSKTALVQKGIKRVWHWVVRMVHHIVWRIKVMLMKLKQCLMK